MPYETDERLKSYLDTNQLARERMCLAVLAIDKRFSDVRPRHPRGGSDGGRDIQARLNGQHTVFGAAGFANQANDSAAQKRRNATKFGEDLDSALTAEPKLHGFLFFTNLSLTLGEKDGLIEKARRKGISFCEIFDRERLRIALDGADGFAIRYQYLGIPLSEAEQAAFFARWGDDIQSVIATGFQSVEATLRRILFLQEANDVLNGLTVTFELDRVYRGEELGPARAFCDLHLKEMKLDLQWILFGITDHRDRSAAADSSGGRHGIHRGISGWQWEDVRGGDAPQKGDKQDDKTQEDKKKSRHNWSLRSESNGAGMDETQFLYAQYSHDYPLIRFQPRLQLRDIDETMFLFMMNASLAAKLTAIHIYANGYKLVEASAAEFEIDPSGFEPDIPVAFTPDEMSDPWVRIRPKRASAFEFSFSDVTPTRIFESRQTPNSLVRAE